MKFSRVWIWRMAALLVLGAVCLAYLRPDMILAAGEALWLCVQ